MITSVYSKGSSTCAECKKKFLSYTQTQKREREREKKARIRKMSLGKHLETLLKVVKCVESNAMAVIKEVVEALSRLNLKTKERSSEAHLLPYFRLL